MKKGGPTGHLFLMGCPERESNSHALRHTILSRACLPFHHPGVHYFQEKLLLDY